MIKNFLNPQGHQNPISGSIVTAILLKVRILPIGGASAGEGSAPEACCYRTLQNIGEISRNWYSVSIREIEYLE